MKKLGVLTVLTAIIGLLIYAFQLDGRYAKAGDLEITNITQTVHLLSHEQTELEAQVWAIEWEQNHRELTQQEIFELNKKKKRIDELKDMKKRYLDKVVE